MREIGCRACDVARAQNAHVTSGRSRILRDNGSVRAHNAHVTSTLGIMMNVFVGGGSG